jgi:hypothetical protein
MAIRELELDARDLTDELSVSPASSEQTPELLSPQGFLGGEDDGLDLLSLEELEQLATQEGIIDPEEEEGFAGEDGFDMLSLEELETLSAQQDAEEEARLAREATKAKEPKIETIPTPLEFMRGEGDTLAQQVSGQAPTTGALEQAFKPFVQRGILSNLILNAKRTEEEKEGLFQDALRADTGVLELDQAAARIEEQAEARGDGLNDQELDMLFAIQDQRDDIEQEARENFASVGRISLDESTSLGEMVQGIYNEPGEFFRQMANTSSRDPALLLAPIGWTKSAATAGTTAKALGASANAVKVSQVVGGNLGVATLAGTAGYVIDAAEQLREKGVIDQTQSIDAGLVTAGFAAALTSVFKGGAGAVKKQRQTAQFNQLVDDELAKFDADKAIDDIINDNVVNNELFLDSGNNLIVSKRVPQPGDIPQKLFETSKAELIRVQEELLANKLAREDRQVVGQHAATLRSEIPNMWQQILDAEDRLADLTVEPGRTASGTDKAVRAQRGNLKALYATHDAAVVELRTLEETLLADRDIGLEIVRIAEDNPTKLTGTEILAQAKKIKDEMGPDDLNWIERRQKLRNEAEAGKEGSRPKILKLFDGTDTRSWEEMGINPEAPMSQTSNVVKNVLKPEADTAWNFIVDHTFGKSVSRLKGLAEVSPTAKKLYNIFRHDQEGIQGEPAHPQRVMSSTGRFVSELETYMDDLRTSLGGFMKKGEAKEVLDIMRGRINRANTPEIQQTANNLRKLLDDFIDYAREAGHPVGKIKNYMPRVYNAPHMKKAGPAARFKALLRSKGLEAGRVNEIYQKIISNDGILDFDPKKLTQERINAETRPLGQRSLDMVSDLELEEFLSNDLYSLMRDYIHSGVRTIEFTRSFGPNGSKLYDMIEQIVKETKDSGNLMEDIELKRIIDLSNALQGSYNRFHSKVAENLMSGAVVFQQMLALPFAVFTSATEPFIGLSRGRPTSWAQGMGAALKSASNRSIRSFVKDFPKDVVTREAEQLGLILPASTAEHLNSLYGGDFNVKLATKTSAAFFRTIFLTQYTEMTRVWAQQAAKIDIVKSLKILSDEGAEFRAEAIKVDLTGSGLDIPKGIDWIRRGGDTTDPYYKSILDASMNESMKVIMSPEATNRPIHFSNPQLAWFNMLLSYPTVFTNTAYKAWFEGFTKGNKYYKTQHGIKTAASIAAMLMVSDQVLTLKEWLTYGDAGNPNLINETSQERTMRAANQAGLLGVGQLAADMQSTVKYGGDAASSRAGPLIGTLNDLAAGIIKAPEDDGDTLKKAATKLFPFLNKSQASRDYIYRNVFSGGRSTKEIDTRPIEFKTIDPARRDLPSIFDRGQRFPEIPMKDDKETTTDDQTSVQTGIQEILTLLKEQAMPAVAATAALPLVGKAPKFKSSFKPSFDPAVMSLAFRKELVQKGGIEGLHKINKPDLIKEIPQIDRTFKQEMIMKKAKQHELDKAKAEDPLLKEEAFLESNTDISTMNTLLDTLVSDFEASANSQLASIPKGLFGKDNKINTALQDAIVPQGNRPVRPEVKALPESILDGAAYPKEYAVVPDEFDFVQNPKAADQGFNVQVYHNTRAKKMFGEFEPSHADLHAIAWDNIGAHVGTKQASNDINKGLLGTWTLPLALKRGKELRARDGGIFKEEDVATLIEMAAADVRKGLKGEGDIYDVNAFFREAGYDTIPYINAVEDKGKVSYIILNKDNVRSSLSEFNVKDATKGGILLGAAGLTLLGATENAEAGEQQTFVDTPDSTSASSFIEDAMPAVEAAVQETGTELFPEVLAAITSLETGWGRHVKGGSYFGVKSQKGDTDTVTFQTKEADESGELVAQEDTFKSFSTFKDSVDGVINFLETNPRYTKAGVFDAETPEEQIQALADAGYATDPEYVEKLTGVLNSVRKRLTTGAPTAPAEPERPAQAITDPSKPTPLDEAEMDREEKMINNLLGLVDLEEAVQKTATRHVPISTAPPREEPVDIEELFSQASPEVKDMIMLKNVFPDASMEEIQEFLEEEANVSNN